MSEQSIRYKCICCGNKPELGLVYWKPAKETDERKVICGKCIENIRGDRIAALEKELAIEKEVHQVCNNECSKLKQQLAECRAELGEAKGLSFEQHRIIESLRQELDTQKRMYEDTFEVSQKRQSRLTALECEVRDSEVLIKVLESRLTAYEQARKEEG